MQTLGFWMKVANAAEKPLTAKDAKKSREGRKEMRD
jgi:hypothetical protein